MVNIKQHLGFTECPSCFGVGTSRIRRVLEDGRVIGPTTATIKGVARPEPWRCEDCSGSGRAYETKLFKAERGQSFKLTGKRGAERQYIVDHNGAIRRVDKLTAEQARAIREAIDQS